MMGTTREPSWALILVLFTIVGVSCVVEPDAYKQCALERQGWPTERLFLPQLVPRVMTATGSRADNSPSASNATTGQPQFGDRAELGVALALDGATASDRLRTSVPCGALATATGGTMTVVLPSHAVLRNCTLSAADATVSFQVPRGGYLELDNVHLTVRSLLVVGLGGANATDVSVLVRGGSIVSATHRALSIFVASGRASLAVIDKSQVVVDGPTAVAAATIVLPGSASSSTSCLIGDMHIVAADDVLVRATGPSSRAWALAVELPDRDGAVACMRTLLVVAANGTQIEVRDVAQPTIASLAVVSREATLAVASVQFMCVHCSITITRPSGLASPTVFSITAVSDSSRVTLTANSAISAHVADILFDVQDGFLQGGAVMAVQASAPRSHVQLNSVKITASDVNLLVSTGTGASSLVALGALASQLGSAIQSQGNLSVYSTSVSVVVEVGSGFVLGCALAGVSATDGATVSTESITLAFADGAIRLLNGGTNTAVALLGLVARAGSTMSFGMLEVSVAFSKLEVQASRGVNSAVAVAGVACDSPRATVTVTRIALAAETAVLVCVSGSGDAVAVGMLGVSSRYSATVRLDAMNVASHATEVHLAISGGIARATSIGGLAVLDAVVRTGSLGINVSAVRTHVSQNSTDTASAQSAAVFGMSAWGTGQVFAAGPIHTANCSSTFNIKAPDGTFSGVTVLQAAGVAQCRCQFTSNCARSEETQSMLRSLASATMVLHIASRLCSSGWLSRLMPTATRTESYSTSRSASWSVSALQTVTQTHVHTRTPLPPTRTPSHVRTMTVEATKTLPLTTFAPPAPIPATPVPTTPSPTPAPPPPNTTAPVTTIVATPAPTTEAPAVEPFSDTKLKIPDSVRGPAVGAVLLGSAFSPSAAPRATVIFAILRARQCREAGERGATTDEEVSRVEYPLQVDVADGIRPIVVGAFFNSIAMGFVVAFAISCTKCRNKPLPMDDNSEDDDDDDKASATENATDAAADSDAETDHSTAPNAMAMPLVDTSEDSSEHFKRDERDAARTGKPQRMRPFLAERLAGILAAIGMGFFTPTLASADSFVIVAFFGPSSSPVPMLEGSTAAFATGLALGALALAAFLSRSERLDSRYPSVWRAFIEGGRLDAHPIVRQGVYFIEVAIGSFAAGLGTGAATAGTACELWGMAMATVGVGQIIYHNVVRPYQQIRDRIFACGIGVLIAAEGVLLIGNINSDDAHFGIEMFATVVYILDPIASIALLAYMQWRRRKVGEANFRKTDGGWGDHVEQRQGAPTGHRHALLDVPVRAVPPKPSEADTGSPVADPTARHRNNDTLGSADDPLRRSPPQFLAHWAALPSDPEARQRAEASRPSVQAQLNFAANKQYYSPPSVLRYTGGEPPGRSPARDPLLL